MTICLCFTLRSSKDVQKKQAKVAMQQKMHENLKSFLTNNSSTTVVDCSDVLNESCGLDVEESL